MVSKSGLGFSFRGPEVPFLTPPKSQISRDICNLGALPAQYMVKNCHQNHSFLHNWHMQQSQGNFPLQFIYLPLSLSGKVDWRLWAIASPAVHLIILLLCFIFVRCGWWPSLHHRRIYSLSLRARTKINQVVEESWEELLCAKDLMDTRLEDGKQLSSKIAVFQLSNTYILLQNATGWFDFSDRTENCEKNTFAAVKAMMSKLPSSDGNKKF